MIGWVPFEETLRGLRSVSLPCRLETVRLEVTVPNQSKLRELVWDYTEAGFVVKIHTPTSATISNKEESLSIWAMVRT